MLLVFWLATAPAKTAPIATAAASGRGKSREGSDALQIIIYNNNII